MNDLATIEKILEIIPHPNADSLDLVKVLGWTCVSNKANGFQVGDKVVYIRTDTVVEDRPEYEFLRNKNFRVKPIRLRGIVSEGLIIPCTEELKNKEEGEDVSEIVGVSKYNKPIPACLAGMAKRASLPYGISQTDETRCQNYPELLEELRGHRAVASLKCDGSSGTFVYKDGEFDVCSRSLSLLEDDKNTFWKLAKELDLEKKMKETGKNLVIRGEVCGPNIQSNRMGLDKHQLFVFDILDGDNLRPYGYFERSRLVRDLGLDRIPTIWEGEFQFTMAELEDMAENLKYDNGSPAEGIVVRPIEEMHSFCMNSRLSFKIVSKQYGMKE